MASPDKNNEILIIDSLGLLAIGAYALCSSLFTSLFAKIQFQLPFLDFPIFIGEILLFFLFLLFLVKLDITGLWRPEYKFWGLYFAWVLLVTCVGYIQWGPLALRNAALFYYVSFALLSFSFFNANLISNKILTSLVFLLLLCLVIFKQMDEYYWYTAVVLLMVFILKRFSNPWRYLALALLFIFSHLDYLFIGSRSHMVGIAGAITFLVIIWLGFLCKYSWKVRLGLAGAYLALSILGLAKISDANAIKSLIDWPAIVKLYKENNQFIKDHSSDYVFKYIPSKLFNPNISISLEKNLHQKEICFRVLSGQQVNQPLSQENIKVPGTVEQPEPKPFVQKSHLKALEEFIPQNSQPQVVVPTVAPSEVSRQPVAADRDLSVAYDNILFRVFIWEDMFHELRYKKFLTGVGFGQPQRSPSLEILGWASSEWTRDGWIAPHNFILHVIYRAGLIGIFLIIVLISKLIHLTRVFISKKDFGGLLLVSILIYWCFQAAFSVTLELPYYAILFWSLFGMIYAYACKERTDGA